MAEQSFIETLPAYCMYLTASCLPSFFAKTLTAPLDRVQLLLQSQDGNKFIRQQEVPRFTTISSTLRRLVQEEGVLSLWNGNTARLLQHLSAEVFFIEFRDKCKTVAPKVELEDVKLSHMINSAIASTITASAYVVFTAPFDYARVRLAGSFRQPAQTVPWMGTLDAWLQTAKGSSNALSVYRGLFPSMLHQLYYRTAYLTFVDTAMMCNPYREEKGWLGAASKFAAVQTGVWGGLFVAYPLDTVKVRLMMEADLPRAERLYRGTWHALSTIVSQENVFRGFGVAALKSVGTAAALSAFYEMKRAYDQVL